jgi:hypothetical protein
MAVQNGSAALVHLGEEAGLLVQRGQLRCELRRLDVVVRLLANDL